MNDSRSSPASLRRGNLLESLASGRMNQQAIESLWLAAQTWIRYGGGLPLERFAGLPSTGPALQQAARNIWLRQAAEQMEPGTDWAQADELAEQFKQFITRGAWCTWRELQHPPEDASKLRTALFYATKFNDGKTLSARQIYRLLS